MPVTTVYFVRHAHADWSPDDDRPLSIAGIEGAQRLKGILSPFPITAIYTTPSRRSVMTIGPLADSLSIIPEIVPDLRERALPLVPVPDFQRHVAELWRSPDKQFNGESHAAARARGRAVLQRVVTRHDGQHVVIGTHGNLLTLILSSYDSTIGYDFWCRLSLPDVYSAEFDGDVLLNVTRCWVEPG